MKNVYCTSGLPTNFYKVEVSGNEDSMYSVNIKTSNHRNITLDSLKAFDVFHEISLVKIHSIEYIPECKAYVDFELNGVKYLTI